jgi:hypothetical protein
MTRKMNSIEHIYKIDGAFPRSPNDPAISYLIADMENRLSAKNGNAALS